MACSADFRLVAVVSLFLVRCEVLSGSNQLQAPVSTAVNDAASICHDGLMSAYLPKAQFADLPFTIYVHDEHSGYYQAVAVAKRCHYFLRETESLAVFTVSSHGCFVRRRKNMTSLTVVIMALTDKGRVEIVKSIRLICERKIKERNGDDYPLESRQASCNKDGFNITVSQNATVPPLNLDAVWIPSSQSQCKPQKRSEEAVTFTFPFSYCGTQSMIADGIITYWVNIEAKQHPKRGSIIRDTPFHLTVYCSFALAQNTHLDIEIQREKPPSTLKSEGLLRIEMRFAKDDQYKFFHSTHGPPLRTKLGQPVYVEVSIVKHEDKDLTLLLDDCWATPTKNPNDLRRWNLLVKGCPFSGDSHRTVVLPVVSGTELRYPSLHKWFVVKMFSIVKPEELENVVFFHCSAEICKGPDCSQSCSNVRRKRRRVASGLGQRILFSIVSGGPLVYFKNPKRNSYFK